MFQDLSRCSIETGFWRIKFAHKCLIHSKSDIAVQGTLSIGQDTFYIKSHYYHLALKKTLSRKPFSFPVVIIACFIIQLLKVKIGKK